MNVDQLIATLGYDRSPHFLRGETLDEYPAFSHVFRQATEESGLRGVYVLQDPAGASVIPTVYVCEALDGEEARLIHRRVWNQNVVPFLLVVTRQDIRVYPGFAYEVEDAPERRLETLVKFTSEALSALDAFRATSIDHGDLWSSRWGALVTPDQRVDWQLLEQLNQLSGWLQGQGLQRSVAHALIGKYVYLHYLRDRGILSSHRLAGWEIAPEALFGRHADREIFFQVVAKLEGWLNGTVFPLNATDAKAVSAEHIRMVAAVFGGDLVNEGQLHLDFRRYDFARIPIETLSVVYEQFLHEDERGRDSGAYYTPVHLVNFMLDELEAKRPLARGMKVLDPACGSGAFLVQCYRRLIEKEQAGGKRLRPVELRELLTRHIFGVDQDRDACQVAGLSLVLTLLDYVEPPDLVRYPLSKIPDLLGRNIIEGDFFRIDGGLSKEGFDWIVSNPPWRDLRSGSVDLRDRPVFDWMAENRERMPVGGHQVAEAFAWKVVGYGALGGAVAMLMPAMTLFKSESMRFRQRFFEDFDVWAVANFANLSQVLFAGRSEVPAAAMFYAPRGDNTERREAIDTFAPFLINQTSQLGKRKDRRTWNIVINGGEVRQVSLGDAMSGQALPWKVAMWGSHRDARLLRKVARRFPSLREFRGRYALALHQGPEFRNSTSGESVEFVEELVGKKRLDVKTLRGKGQLFSLPSSAFQTVSRESAYVRQGRVRVPLTVCRPPHIFVDEARRFAVFSNEFFVIPARQVGISGENCDAALLKALVLLMNSEFTHYHQFLTSIQWGVQKNIANRENLDALPVPLDSLNPETLKRWVDLHDALADIDSKSHQESEDFLTSPNEENPTRQALITQLNELVFDALKITQSERLLIQDLVHGRLGLTRGKVDKALMVAPSIDELTRHASILLTELNDFLSPQLGLHHHIRIYPDRYYGVLEITLDNTPSPFSTDIPVVPVSEKLSHHLRQLREQLGPRHDQWLYFERKLTLFDGPRTYLLKPMQRLQWLPSQALLDADSLIADTLAATGGEGSPVVAVSDV